jgi:Fe-S cluster assembly protein SufD
MKTIIEEINNGVTSYDYKVSKDEHLTLILRAIHKKNIDVTVRVHLMGRGASAVIIGFVVGSGDSIIKFHTFQLHEAPETTSNLLVKSALSGYSSCIIDGGIRVEKFAQKTDAYQRNENLLLSEDAHAESKPSLEILADDVRCTHGATVGPVSEEEVWFLATRGISKIQATSLIVKGFFRKATDLVEDEKVRLSLWQSIEGEL